MDKLNNHLLAEWQPQKYTLLAWPHQHSDWKTLLSDTDQCYQAIASTVSEYQEVLIICYDQRHQQHITKLLKKSNLANIHFICIKTNDTWIRDYGPISTSNGLINYKFNAWGEKHKCNLDNNVNQQLFNKPLFANYQTQDIDIVLEGGSLETNGEGLLLSTKQCVLNKNRNGFTQEQFELHAKTHLGCEQVILLDNGDIIGDDTDSHIDTLARFANEKTLLHSLCLNPDDPQYQSLHNMQQELQSLHFELIALPLPEALYGLDGQRLPANYANFLITNEAILCPTYNTTADSAALSILRDCFPKYLIKPLDCRALIEQNGSLHCATMNIGK